MSRAAVMLTPRMRASTALRTARGYSSAVPPPGKTPIPPPSSSSSSSSSQGRRFGVGRAVWYGALGVALFYGGSVPVSHNSPEYKKFFEESVYGGKDVLAFFDRHDLRKELDALHLDDTVSSAANQVRSGFTRLSDRVLHSERVQNTREEVEKQAAELQSRVQHQIEELKHKAGDDGHVLEKQVQDLRANSTHWLEQAAELAEKSLKGLGERATDLAHDVRDRLPEEVRNAIPVPTHRQEEEAEFFGGELPVGFEPPVGYAAPRKERKLQAPSDSKGRLRADPDAPKLPKLAPALGKLSGSEPIVSQLASTIDELAAFARDSPSASSVAKGVLESAQADLKQLVTRLDQIKSADAKKLEEQLAQQAKKFEAEIAQNAKQATGDLDKRDKDWQKKIEAIQAEQTAQFKGRLAKELETQSAIINERLREEVLAQGVELQRKWSREIKAKVEQERAGRLARLDELTDELHRLEAVSVENAKSLDDNASLHALAASLRQLRAAIDGGVQAGEANAYVRRTFAKELDVLRSQPKAKDNELIAAAVQAIDQTHAPKEGLESEPTLREWFTRRLAPRLRSVALLPDQGAGVLCYLTSMAFSPLLFNRKGLVPGTDVASTVARAEWYLEHKDLDRAAREINQLQGWAKVLASDWLEAARKRLEVDQALQLVEKESSFAQLLKT